MAGETWQFGEIKVRPARARDALALLALHRSVLDEGEFFITRSEEFAGTLAQRELQIRQLSEPSSGVYLVALIATEVLGFLTVHTGPLKLMQHAGKLEVMVAKQARGQGVGRALLSACIDWTERLSSLDKLGLTVFADNERAIALYRAYGFEEEGRRRREYKLSDGSYRDDLLMYRFISRSGPQTP